MWVRFLPGAQIRKSNAVCYSIFVDQGVEEVKELVVKDLELTQDTNRIVHQMRRSARWGRFFQIIWWVAVLAVSGAAYYYYLQPYVKKLQSAYTSLQTTGQRAQGLETQVQNFFKNIGSSTSTQNATSTQQ